MLVAQAARHASLGGTWEMPARIATDVLVVGAGPAGAASAVFLGKHGVRTVTISRSPSTADTPRAHIMNQRTMEALRDAGLEAECVSQANPASTIEHTFWLRSLAGEELARTFSWGNDPLRKGDYEAASPCSMCDLPQTLLEPLLLAEAGRLGSQIRFGTELLSFTQDANGVTAVCRDGLTDQTFEIDAKYMIGADGARSRIMEALGIELDGQPTRGNMINVFCRVDLADQLIHRHGSMYGTIQPGSLIWAPVAVVRMVRAWDQWVFGLVVPEAQGRPNPSAGEMKQRIYEIIGDPSIPVEVLHTSTWTINNVVARRYSEGRVFCIGDAVHRHPPTNGLGSNTCIQDAFNLAWKLALVLEGKAGPRLLETLNDERQPVGKQIVARANKSMSHNNIVWDLLGGGTQKIMSPAEHAAVFNTQQGRNALSEAIDAMQYEFHAHGVELNRSYHSSATVPDGTSERVYNRDPELYYQPSTRPGSPFPHFWVGRRSGGARVSSLDLVGKRRFCLATGHGGDGWRTAAAAIADELRVEVRVITIGPYLDWEDLYRTWSRVSEINEDGCVLVRPDLYVGWRCSSLPHDPRAALSDVMQQILAT
jgi:2,4-dichlorophenol 6-monooxygenase